MPPPVFDNAGQALIWGLFDLYEIPAERCGPAGHLVDAKDGPYAPAFYLPHLDVHVDAHEGPESQRERYQKWRQSWGRSLAVLYPGDFHALIHAAAKDGPPRLRIEEFLRTLAQKETS